MKSAVVALAGAAMAGTSAVLILLPAVLFAGTRGPAAPTDPRRPS